MPLQAMTQFRLRLLDCFANARNDVSSSLFIIRYTRQPGRMALATFFSYEERPRSGTSFSWNFSSMVAGHCPAP